MRSPRTSDAIALPACTVANLSNSIINERRSVFCSHFHQGTHTFVVYVKFDSLRSTRNANIAFSEFSAGEFRCLRFRSFCTWLRMCESRWFRGWDSEKWVAIDDDLYAHILGFMLGEVISISCPSRVVNTVMKLYNEWTQVFIYTSVARSLRLYIRFSYMT